MHNPPVTSETIELVERVRQKLAVTEASCGINGPAAEAAIDAAEEALGCTFPPSYRTFLRTFGGISLPPHLGIVHDFVGVRDGAEPDAHDVVRRTLRARAEKRFGGNLIVVGIGANQQEWFCLDVNRPDPQGEYPVVMFDAHDNARDQQFYDDFGQMFSEVMGFVAETLEQPLD
jgi:cell wall assembly regulator SMI1